MTPVIYVINKHKICKNANLRPKFCPKKSIFMKTICDRSTKLGTDIEHVLLIKNMK